MNCYRPGARVCDVLLRAGMGVLCSFMGAIALHRETEGQSRAILFFASVEENWLHLPPADAERTLL